MTETAGEEMRFRKFDRKLWLSLLGAPLLWLVYLQTAYLFVRFACSSGQRFVLHIATGLFLGLTFVLGTLSYGQWRQLGGGWPSDKEQGSMERRRTMAMIGLLQSSLFAMIILTSWGAISILDPCQGASRP